VDAITTTLDSGWVLYQLPKEGFSIALPPGWLPVDVSAEGLVEVLDVLWERNPQLGGVLGGQATNEMVAQGIVFYALDSSPAALELGTPASVNVVKVDIGITLPLDVVVPLTLGPLEELALPGVSITNERIDLEGLEAEMIKYAGELSTTEGDALPVSFTMLLVPVGGTLYVISVSAPADLEEDTEDLLQQIGLGFRLLE
jgi:hypothetical protein